ncbi:ArdC family protein [Caballeronia sp. TF1N1]|uniref:ArdC family protein n=1 Tax=Caballeronia sp. TF1N1 TaxID=2878153 RepID=UPI001FD2DD6C|nr:zincin-like metallopeptidase domain-containing protein [Caballeronia sp. TF1N1]
MKAQTKASSPDIYSRVTNKIIADLEQGVRPWVKPWNAGNVSGRITLPVRHNGMPYQGINILLLWGEQLEKGFASNRWMTFKQVQALGANVRKGEHGALVVYASKVTKTSTDDHGDEIEREIPFMKGYTVFNIDQIENLPAEYCTELTPVEGKPLELIEHAEAFFAKTNAVIRHGGNMAYYAPTRDIVQLPIPQSFETAESYAATKAHEITHWTSHKTRLDRQLGKRFSDEVYVAEELIAEMGAAFLCAQLGLTPEVRDDHAAYLDHWLKVLKGDKKAIFTAASQAQKACEFLFSMQGDTTLQAA